MRIFILTICILLPLSLAYGKSTYSESSDSNNDIHAETGNLGAANIGPDHRVKRNDDPNVDLNDGEDQGDETNQDSSNDDGSGQSENRSRRDSEDEGDNDNGGGNDYDIIDGDKEVGNDSDDEGSEGEEQVVLEKADKQKRHLMESFIPEDGELQKLMSESSDLSKEAEQVFEAISDREVKLLREMELLKNALSMAVSKLKTSLQAEVTELDEKTSRQRRDYNFQKPYKACVSIEPSAPDQQYSGFGQNSRGAGAYLPKGLGSSPPIPQPPADVREFIPSKGDPLIKPSAPVKRPALPPSSQPRAPVGPRPDQVDLSQVVWLRLHPERKQEELKKKVDLLLKEKQNKGKDVLIIPVNHNLKNTEEVKTEFLHAVRVKPGALKHHNFRQLRSLAVVEY